MIKRTPQSGFTLIEVLVYMAILVIVSAASVTALISYLDLMNEQKVKRILTANATLALERMTREIRNAEAVHLSGSTLDDPQGVLDLTKDTNDITFSYNAGNIDVLTGGVTQSLISEDASVDEVTFQHYTTGNTELVRIVLTVTATSSDYSNTETFYAGTVIRGSYD